MPLFPHLSSKPLVRRVRLYAPLLLSTLCHGACGPTGTMDGYPAESAANQASGGTSDGTGGTGNSLSGGAGTLTDNTGGTGTDDSLETGTTGCAEFPQTTPLYAASEVTPIIVQLGDATLVTRGAGRVRGRHELEGQHAPYLERYFENRSYSFEIADRVAAGGNTITVTYRPEAPVSEFGAQTNFRFWKVYGDGNVFHSNVGMEKLEPQLLQYTVDYNPRANRPMALGDILEFEFGIFIAGNNAQDPDAIEGRTAYYTDTFRYQVGIGGLTAESADPAGILGPAPAEQLTGTGTVPWLYEEQEMSYSQMMLNIQPEHVQPFLQGRRLFHTDFGDGSHSEGGNPDFTEQAGKLGPLTSARDCASCHPHNGRGQLPELGAPLQSAVVKLYGPDNLGNQLQSQEGQATLSDFETHSVELADGASVTLRKPRFSWAGVVDSNNLRPSIRVARQLPGMGLLEAIADTTILQAADPDDCNNDGVSGRPQLTSDPEDPGLLRVGRFGWKAEKVSVAHQVADALLADMGVTSPLLPEGQAPELASADFEDLVTYMSLLALPGRRQAADPVVQRGATLFNNLGCVRCHRPESTTGSDHALVELHNQTIQPYTDLLLHDMGPDLADDSGTAQASEWRTPPLWGLGLLATVSGHSNLLHDGRARTPLEAILWHGGEAAFAREGVRSLTTADREALLAFLQSL